MMTEEEIEFIRLTDWAEHIMNTDRMGWDEKHETIFGPVICDRLNDIANETDIVIERSAHLKEKEDSVRSYVDKITDARDRIINKYA